ncbi:MAG: hypothetical protein AABX51_05440 [Nanoarchaeota archaeon]
MKLLAVIAVLSLLLVSCQNNVEPPKVTEINSGLQPQVPSNTVPAQIQGISTDDGLNESISELNLLENP